MRKKIIKTAIILVLLPVVLYFTGRYWFKLGGWQYDTYEEFNEKSYNGFKLDIPEGATDQKFFYRNAGFGRYSVYAFTLEKDSYDRFIGTLVEKYKLEGDPSSELNNKYGYPAWYMMKVKDATDLEYELDEFPVNLHFENVIDDDIRDYDIIVYSPMGTGTSGRAITANPDTGRIVVYSQGNIR